MFLERRETVTSSDVTAADSGSLVDWLTPNIRDRSGSKSESVASNGSESGVEDRKGSSGEEEELSSSATKCRHLHLYILRPTTPMLALIRAAWTNFNVDATLLADKQDDTTRNPIASKSSSQVQHLFNQLQSELQDSDNSVEESFSLLSELHSAAALSTSVRRCFWKSDEMPRFLSGELRKYTKGTTVASSDELELVIMLLETWSVMLRNTDSDINRIQYFKANKGSPVYDMVEMTVSVPGQVTRHCALHISTSSGTPTLCTRPDVARPDAFTHISHTEIVGMAIELINAATSLVYELLHLAHQTPWMKQWGKSELSIQSVFKLINQRQSQAVEFVDLMLTELFTILESGTAGLTGREAVLTYHTLFVLQDMLTYSDSIRAHITHQYREEFRYYMNKKHFSSLSYPIVKDLLPMLDKITEKVRG